jgi:hypothetical protein
MATESTVPTIGPLHGLGLAPTEEQLKRDALVIARQRSGPRNLSAPQWRFPLCRQPVWRARSALAPPSRVGTTFPLRALRADGRELRDASSD